VPRKRLVVIAVTTGDELMHIRTEIHGKTDTVKRLALRRDVDFTVMRRHDDTGLRLQKAQERCGIGR
jgi:hypothetical protein